MREILFRGKDIRGYWHIGLLAHMGNGWYIQQSWVSTAYEVIPDTIGQYTGLTDKSGTKIFEGDIIKGAWGTLCRIYFDESYLQFRAKEFTYRTTDNSIDYYGDNSRLEVVGNVYDNPDSRRYDK